MIQLVLTTFLTLPFLFTADQVNYGESVSSEPLTFEIPKQEPVDRWSLLREASVYMISDDPYHAAGGRRASGTGTGVVVAAHPDHEGAVHFEPAAGSPPTDRGGEVQAEGEATKGDIAVARRLRRVDRDRSIVEVDRPDLTDEIGQDGFNKVRIRAPHEGLSLPDDIKGSAGRSLQCTMVKIMFKVDKYGKETTVKLIGSGGAVMSSVNEVAAYQTKTMTSCVEDGTYTFKLTDIDGICCGNGKGWYKLYVGGTLLVSGGYFIGSKTHTIKIGYDWRSRMDSRDTEWLRAHNARRRLYNGGAGYKALRWANSLAQDAKQYAEVLADGFLAYDCKNYELTHDHILEGENLASNQGHGEWGGMYPADKIVGRFVERELSWPHPDNAHFTQVVWRATSYVGCGESVRQHSSGRTCRVQVCRYQPPGNCGIINHNWQAEAWKDETACGEQCPTTEGCYK
ncbi:hypothetical protein ACHAXA_011096 [Cyclostephanos tholiformis]|uniref:SCP domain-containing protein n=1 Tax=Cyclostephanos tholiformis TaxID=382380 RepID=A0ABD3SFA7_9STRA